MIGSIDALGWEPAFRVVLLLQAVLLASAGFVHAQEASIGGRVVDASGAVIPGVTLTATNVDTGIRNIATSNAEGQYEVRLLPPGRYTLTAELSGFRPETRTGLVLAVQQAVQLDFGLEVGAVSETVQVSVPLVDSRGSSLGHVIDNTSIRELPLNGRNPLELSRLTPGVTLLATAFLDTRNFNLTSVSINGGQGGSNAVMLDGGSATLPERNEYSVVPNVDAVQEYRVQTNALAAEFGMTGGGTINLVTKSGTNQFRGSVFEFVRNDAFDATGWTNNRNHLPKSPLRYNQFGGTAGGPIRLPKGMGPLAYDGRNRSFFFFSYEGIRYTSATTVLSRVPTDLERAGDFSQTFVRTSSSAFIPVRLYDPATTSVNPAGSGYVRAPFATSVIPTTRLDPAAIQAIANYPLPNRQPDDLTGRNNFISTPELVSDSNQYTGRVDHQITTSNTLFVRYSQQDHVNTGNSAIYAVDNIADPGLSLQTRHNKNGIVGDTHAFGSGALHEARLSFSRQYLLSAPAGYNVGAPALIGLPAIIPSSLFPRFEIGNDVTGSDVQSLGSSFNQLSQRGLTVVQLTDSLSMLRGRHSIKTGVDLRVHQRNNTQSGAVSGQFNFARAMTGDPQDTSGSTGFGLATFLLGAVSGGNLNSSLARADGFNYYGAFVQDDYRVWPRLTLNLGVRYDVITAPTDRFDRYSNFNPTAINPVTGTPGVLQYAGVDFGRQVYHTNYGNIGPRVGFAYDASGNGRTVVRGGYGILYYHSANFEYPDTQGYSVSTPFQSAQGANFPAFQLSAGPSTLLEPSGSSLGPLSFLGNNVTYFERKRPTPSTQQWNLDVQHELPGSMLVDVAYAGSRGTHIVGSFYDLNQLDPKYLALGLQLDDPVPNPFFGRIPQGPLSGPTISRRQSLRPYPDYLNITVQNPPLGSTIYHSAQLKMERRFSAGWGFLGSYTFSRLVGDVGRNIIDFGTVGGAPQGSVPCGQDAKFDRRSCRSIEPQDVTHQFVLSALYDLPFGTGRRFFSSGGTLASIVGGFRLNTIVSLRSGLPLVIRGANAKNGPADRPNMVGDPELPAGDRSAERWFNTDAFAAPAPFTYGDTPRALSNARGPGVAAVDLSLTRDIVLSDRFSVQLRAEAFNLFNRTNLNLPNTNSLSDEFGRITSADFPRRVQFGAKLYW